MTTSNESTTIGTRGSALKWVELLNESVHTSDDQDIGDIEAVNREFIVVKRGFVNIHRYFIPADKIEGWDGYILWLKITEDEVKRKYQKDDALPDPGRYLIKDFENYYNYGVYPPVGWVPVRYAVPPYPVPATTSLAKEEEELAGFKCDLCGSIYREENKFSEHVKKVHK